MCLQALDLTQRNAGYTSLEHSVPVLCFGEGKDMELSLCTESNSLPLATQVFEKVWIVYQIWLIVLYTMGFLITATLDQLSHAFILNALMYTLANTATYKCHTQLCMSTPLPY